MDKGLVRPNAHRAEGTNGTPTENGLRESGAGNGRFLLGAARGTGYQKGVRAPRNAVPGCAAKTSVFRNREDDASGNLRTFTIWQRFGFARSRASPLSRLHIRQSQGLPGGRRQWRALSVSTVRRIGTFAKTGRKPDAQETDMLPPRPRKSTAHAPLRAVPPSAPHSGEPGETGKPPLAVRFCRKGDGNIFCRK